MTRSFLLFLLLLLSLCSRSQITFVGHNRINNEALKHTTIIVKEGSRVTQTLSTGPSSDFLLKLNYGKDYRIYFQNVLSPLICVEVLAANVPEQKFEHKMVHEANVLFYNKNDDDVDTSIFKDPFYKIVFDGTSKMISDSAYNNDFATRILRVKAPESNATTRALTQEPFVTIAGQILLNNNNKLTVNNRTLLLYNKKGQVIKSTSTNRHGSFSFSNVKTSEIAQIKIELKKIKISDNIFTLVNSKNQTVSSASIQIGVCIWTLTTAEIDKLIDNNFTFNIGGKLICSSAKHKKLFEGKTVYLTNRYNTIIKKTKTTMLGTFVFEGLKPDNNYLIGVDRKDLKPGEKLDLLNKDDKFVCSLDTIAGQRVSFKLKTNYNSKFNDISISDAEMTMNVNANIYGDNLNNPIGKLKVILLSDNYSVIDSAVTDNFGAFKFTYLPFLKRFYLSAENSDNVLDVFNNILVYNKDNNLVKIMTHEKGNKFSYKPLGAEIIRLREVELEDPWLEFVDHNKTTASKKLIIENLHFDNNSFEIKGSARKTLDKVLAVMQSNKKLRLEIGAHTDSEGNSEANLKLSEMRATTVCNYLIKAGIDKSRLTSFGYGSTQPINKCLIKPCTEAERAQNRRIEFKIIE